MAAVAFECTRRNLRNGSALRLDARIVGRGALRVPLRGRRWVRPGTHRLNLQHNRHALAQQLNASLCRAQDFCWSLTNPNCDLDIVSSQSGVLE
jgi:hypothetical protein